MASAASGPGLVDRSPGRSTGGLPPCRSRGLSPATAAAGRARAVPRRQDARRRPPVPRSGCLARPPRGAVAPAVAAPKVAARSPGHRPCRRRRAARGCDRTSSDRYRRAGRPFLGRGRPRSVMRDDVLAVPGAVIERARIVTQGLFDARAIPQADGQVDVVPRAAIDEEAGHVRRLADQVLGRRRFVIHVARVEVGAALYELTGDVDRPRAVQRRLAVAAACLDQRRIRVKELAHAIVHPEMGGSPHVHDCPARDQRHRLLGRAVGTPAARIHPPTSRSCD